MRVAIVGSRDYPNLAAVRRYVLALPKDTIIVSGGARGVDRAGELAAYEAHFAVEIFFPDYNEYGKEAPFIRNGQIARRCDRLVCFWDGRSTGSAHVMAMAKKLGKPVEVIVCRRAPRGGSDNPGVLQPLPDHLRPTPPAAAQPALSRVQLAARRRRGLG